MCGGELFCSQGVRSEGLMVTVTPVLLMGSLREYCDSRAVNGVAQGVNVFPPCFPVGREVLELSPGEYGRGVH